MKPHLGKMRPIWVIYTKSGQKRSRIGENKFNHASCLDAGPRALDGAMWMPGRARWMPGHAHWMPGRVNWCRAVRASVHTARAGCRAARAVSLYTSCRRDGAQRSEKRVVKIRGAARRGGARAAGAGGLQGRWNPASRQSAVWAAHAARRGARIMPLCAQLRSLRVWQI